MRRRPTARRPERPRSDGVRPVRRFPNEKSAWHLECRYSGMPLKRRRGTDPIPDTVVVETQEGVRLRCSISVVGRETEPRWMIIDENGEQFVGPVVTSARSAEDVGRL